MIHIPNSHSVKNRLFLDYYTMAAVGIAEFEVCHVEKAPIIEGVG
jgi:hypothetical protein